MQVKLIFPKSETCKKKVLKEVALFFVDKPVEMEQNRQFHQWCSFVLDFIKCLLTKQNVPANVCTLNFVNKGMEDVNVSKIFQTKNAIGLLLLSLQDYKNLPLTTYKVAATIRNKAFN